MEPWKFFKSEQISNFYCKNINKGLFFKVNFVEKKNEYKPIGCYLKTFSPEDLGSFFSGIQVEARN